MILARLIDLYSLVVIAAVVISWMQIPPRNPLVQITRALTDPALAPLRKILPPLGGLDLSPMVLLVGMQLVKGMLI